MNVRVYLYVYHIVFVLLYSIFDVCFGGWRHGLKRKSLYSESLIQCLFWGQTISGNCKRILWYCCSILVFLISSLLYLYLYLIVFVFSSGAERSPRSCRRSAINGCLASPLDPLFSTNPAQAHCILCSVFLDAISHPYIHFFQPNILCWTQTHSLANCNLYSLIHVLHWNLSTTTTPTSILIAW